MCDNLLCNRRDRLRVFRIMEDAFASGAYDCCGFFCRNTDGESDDRVVKILFSTTLTGLIWCIGYIGYNHFKGTEDPDWDKLNPLNDTNDYEEERRVS